MICSRCCEPSKRTWEIYDADAGVTVIVCEKCADELIDQAKPKTDKFWMVGKNGLKPYLQGLHGSN